VNRRGRRWRLGSTLLWVAALAGLGGILGSLGHLAWWLELFSHFRLQYAALLAVSGAGLLFLGRPVIALASIALAAANALPMLHYYAAPPSSQGSGPEIRAVLANVFFRNGNHEGLLAYVRRVKPDLAVFLEVTPEWRDALRSLADALPYQAYAGELFVASRQPLRGLHALPISPGATLAVAFAIDVSGSPVTVIGAHANWPLGAAIAASRDHELASLAEIAQSTRGPLLLLGDFNTTAFSPAFAALLAHSGLADCAAGRGYHPTWPTWFPPLYIQIDHCLAGPDLQVTSLSTGPYVGSDHYPLEVSIRLSDFAGGRGAELTASRAPPTSRR
jgi:endonuclease/exonuclease/phosphatase (EEP) superfamily protein YafD